MKGVFEAFQAGEVKRRREAGKASLYVFIQQTFHLVEPGETFVGNWHVEDMCRHLEAMYRGEILERQIAFCIPPGCMKSLITSVFFPVWCWLQDASIRFATISYSEELTGIRDGGKVVRLIHSKYFQRHWGDLVSVPSDPARSNILTKSGGFRYATSIGGMYTGQHVHFEIVDDPISAKDLSKAKLEAVKVWRTRVAPTRLLPVKEGEAGGRIYIMQRLHEEDAVGEAEREERETPGSWVFVRYPMRFEPKAKCVTKWGGDIRTEDGELLWPERFGEELVKKREGQLGPKDTAAQFQQRPVPDGGLVFNAETFRYYQMAPAKFDEVIMSVDAAFKDADTSDLVAISVWGRLGGEFYLLDMVWRRLSFTATLEAIRLVTRKWPRARAKLIEDKANGSAIINTLKKEISGIIPVDPEGGKEARANAVEPYFSAGNVKFPDPKGCVTRPDKSLEQEKFEWVDRLVLELLGFPFAAHDDGVDTTTQALLYFRMKGTRWAETMKKLKGTKA